MLKPILPFLLLFATYTVAAQNAISKKYNRQIAFANSEITAGTEKEASFITEYKPGDPLYYRLYRDSTIKQFIDKWRHTDMPVSAFKYLCVRYYIDGTYAGENKIDLKAMSDQQFSGTAGFGSSMFGGATNDPFSLSSNFKDLMILNTDKLKGKHVIKIEIYMFDKYHTYELLGTGSLNLNSDGENITVSVLGIKNEFHKKHIGKIVFGTKPLGAELNESDVIKDYTIGDPLYYRVFMDNTLKNYITKGYNNVYQLSYFNHMYVKFYLDGEYMKMDNMDSQGPNDLTEDEMASLTTFNGFVMLDKTTKDYKQSLIWAFKKFLYKYNKACAGTHKLKMEVYLYAQGLNQTVHLLGDGELTIHLANVNSSHPQLGYKPSAAMADHDLETKMINAYNEVSKGDAMAKKAYLKSTDWDIYKNELTGAIVNKYRSAVLLVQTKEGNCSYQEMVFAMDYEGNGKYGNVHFNALAPGGCTNVLCECTK